MRSAGAMKEWRIYCKRGNLPLQLFSRGYLPLPRDSLVPLPPLPRAPGGYDAPLIYFPWRSLCFPSASVNLYLSLQILYLCSSLPLCNVGHMYNYRRPPRYLTLRLGGEFWISVVGGIKRWEGISLYLQLLIAFHRPLSRLQIILSFPISLPFSHLFNYAI